jgi:hypothetical protein
VLEVGEVAAGDEIVKVGNGPESMSVAEADAQLATSVQKVNEDAGSGGPQDPKTSGLVQACQGVTHAA